MNKSEFISSSLVIFSIPIFLYASVVFFQSFRETGYEAVKGEVINSKIDKYRFTRAGETSGSVSWRLYVDYEYHFNGQNFENDVVATSLPISTTLFGRTPSKKLRHLEEKFQAGNKITVYIDVENPAKSVLMRSTFSKVLKSFLLGLVFLMTAFFLKSRS